MRLDKEWEGTTTPPDDEYLDGVEEENEETIQQVAMEPMQQRVVREGVPRAVIDGITDVVVEVAEQVPQFNLETW